MIHQKPGKKHDQQDFRKFGRLKTYKAKIQPSGSTTCRIPEKPNDQQHYNVYPVDDPVKIQQPAVVHQRNYNHHHETKNHTDQLSRLQRSFCTSHQQHSDSADHQKPDDQPEIIIFQSVKFKHVKILYPFWILTVYLL